MLVFTRAWTTRLFLHCLLLVPMLAASATGQSPHRTPLVPLLWTQGQSPETIRKVVKEVAAGGNTGFVWESRPHPNYLGPKWWADLRVAVEEAKRLSLEVWIFDEWMYPSGIAGGKVIEENPEFAHHVLLDRALVIRGPTEAAVWELPSRLGELDQVVSVTAFAEPYEAGRDPIDLTPFIQAKGQQVVWAAPPGNWRICWGVARREGLKEGWRMDNMIDVLNPKAVAAFIRLTHEATWREFKEDFGTTVKGFFSDETGFRNITSYHSLPGTPGMPMPWSPAFLDYFQRVKGYDPRPLLASLWYDLGPRGRACRFDLMDAFARCFAETFFKPQQEWCRAHGVQLIGHVVEDNDADHQLGYGPGHWFRSMEYFDIPGIDVVGYQVTPGLDAAGNRWLLDADTEWDQEFFQFGLPAMARGASLLKNSGPIFSEAFGANGWNEGLRMVKWIGDWHIVNGIGMLSPHAMTMRFHDPDCPPHFNRTSGSSQWRYYSTWASYFRRLQSLLADTSPIVDVAVLYTAESRWMGPAMTVSPVVKCLETHQISTAVLPYEVWATQGSIKGSRWTYNGQSFKAVVLPYVHSVPASVARRLAMFAQAGGHVVVLDRWPQTSVDGREDQSVQVAVDSLKASPHASLTVLPELPQVLTSTAAVELSPASTQLVVSRRRSAAGEWLLLHNRSLVSPIKGRLFIKNLSGPVTRYAAEMDGYFRVPATQGPDGTTVEVEIPPYALWAMRLGKQIPAPQTSPHFTKSLPLGGEWLVGKATDDSGDNFEPLTPKTGLEDWRRWHGFESYAGTVRYRRNFRLLPLAPDEAIRLDAGSVEEIADLKVNGKTAGIRICPPYVWDITNLAKPGQNSIELDITNRTATRWADEFSHGSAVSGLLGPVQVLKGQRSPR
jgi:hypothetical protein